MQKLRRLMVGITATALLATSIPAPAFAQDTTGLVTTAEASGLAADVQGRVQTLLARADVREGLVARGVDPSAVEARVAALTDTEARQLADQLDRLPAGGDTSVIGVLFTIFIILLITDILGLTKIFPFTRPVR
jgi:hypothetical protein